MFVEKKPLGLKIVVALALVNSLATLAYFVLLIRGILKPAGLVENVWVYALTVIVIAVFPVILGACGLNLEKVWGLGFFTVGSGAYLFLSAVILMTSIASRNFKILFYVSVYLFLYHILASFYAWIFRHHLKDF